MSTPTWLTSCESTRTEAEYKPIDTSYFTVAISGTVKKKKEMQHKEMTNHGAIYFVQGKRIIVEQDIFYNIFIFINSEKKKIRST